MKRYFEIFAALFLGTTMMFSCQQAEEPTMDQGTVPQTRAYGDTPVVAIYVETNDTNPLNAGDYMLSNGKPCRYRGAVCLEHPQADGERSGRAYALPE